ncbi:response regulator [Geomonas limicola]|uniref:Response regulator n=1 Tax=Geomonas limicola TaxID=2740186 RepID=A0A6V8NDW5_9BACT|nr:response regulator [Geomonas limicola]GFO70014.1 response regulator [Geomonas limicola]
MKECEDRELWLLGLGDKIERGAVVCSYLAEGGYRAKVAGIADLAKCTPLAILLDISPWSDDGWGILQTLNGDPATRDIPVLPLYLSENGQVGEVFPVAGFFTLPLENGYLTQKLQRFGLTDESDDYDLQAMVVTRKGEERLEHAIVKLGFEVVNAYTGKEAIALGTIVHPYMIFCSLMLPDQTAFDLLERFRLYPQTRNIPFFVLLKEAMKEGERGAMSHAIDHLVRKNYLTRDEFLSYFKKSA